MKKSRYHAARSRTTSNATRSTGCAGLSGPAPVRTTVRQHAATIARAAVFIADPQYTPTRMKKISALAVALLASVTLVAQTPVRSPNRPAGTVSAQSSQSTYFPARFDWQHKRPDEVGMNAGQVDQAVQAAIAGETTGPKDMIQFLTNSFGKEPFFSLIGPVKDRGPASGVITRH